MFISARVARREHLLWFIMKQIADHCDRWSFNYFHSNLLAREGLVQQWYVNLSGKLKYINVNGRSSDFLRSIFFRRGFFWKWCGKITLFRYSKVKISRNKTSWKTRPIKYNTAVRLTTTKEETDKFRYDAEVSTQPVHGIFVLEISLYSGAEGEKGGQGDWIWRTDCSIKSATLFVHVLSASASKRNPQQRLDFISDQKIRGSQRNSQPLSRVNFSFDVYCTWGSFSDCFWGFEASKGRRSAQSLTCSSILCFCACIC